jgi:hypothetical protein
MDRLIEVYRGDYWQPAIHLLMLAALVYGCITIPKHAGPSVFVILSVLFEFAAFWGYAGWIHATRTGDPVRTYMRLGDALGLAALMALCVAIFGWRSRPRREVGTPPNGSP